MNPAGPWICVAALAASAPAPTLAAAPNPQASDPRLREVVYDPRAIVTVPVRRGEVTLVQFMPDEAITDLAAGLGGDCVKADVAWCLVAQSGGRALFVKAKSTAGPTNTVAVVTDRRTHMLRFEVLQDRDPKPPVYRLQIKAPAPVAPRLAVAATPIPLLPAVQGEPAAPTPQELVAHRLQTKAQVLNTAYSIAEGEASRDIVPTLIFDDGRFTYLRFPGNRELPAVFHVLPDGNETVLNTRMEDDLLVVDRVSRRLMLRAGQAVVGIWNDAFDLDGVPPEGGTTVEGVQRVLRTGSAPSQPATRVTNARGTP